MSTDASPRFMDDEANALLDNFSDDTDEDEIEDPLEVEPDPRVLLHENGVVGPTQIDMVSNAKFKHHYAEVAHDLAVKNKLAAEAKIKSDTAEHAVQKQTGVVAKLRKEARRGDAAARAALAAAEGSLHTLEEIAAREAKVLNHAEQMASRAEVTFGKLREQAAAEHIVEVQNRKLLQLKAATISQKRDEVLRSTNSRRQSRHAAAVARANEIEEQRSAQLGATMQAMKAARARVARLGKEVKAGAATLTQLQTQTLAQRSTAVTELKKSIEREYKKIEGRNDKLARKEAELRQREQAEHNEILREGRNPYEVFRRRRLKKEQQKKLHQLQTNIRDKKMAIAERMLRDDEFLRKRDKKAQADKEHEQSYKNSLKRSHKDKKIEAYMKSVTKSGTGMVDPTGRAFRLDPSKLTTVKNNKFGLGGADADVIRKLEKKKKLRNVEPASILLRKSRSPGSSDDKRRSNNGHDSDDDMRPHGDDDIETGSEEEPDADLDPAAATIYGSAMAGLFQKTAAPRAQQSAGNQRASSAPTTAKRSQQAASDQNKLATRELSVLEKNMITDALSRQKDNLVSKQVVWGKEFTGRAFLSKPDVIEFKDFVVGQKMRRSIVLTNVSYSFNTFKVLDLPDEVRDFFHIKYTRPGRMSAGMTCTLQITFVPKTQHDIHAELPLLAQTGPFTIPIVCLAKKAKPVLSTRVLHLEDVVTGEEESCAVTLSNLGALDTGYEIIRRGHFADDKFRGRGDEVEDQNISESHLSMLHFPTSGIVKSRKQRTLTFSFVPTEAGVDFTLRLLVRFSDPNCPDQEIKVRASSAKVPIYVQQKVVDFRCCVVGKLYRCDFVLCNRGKSALKAQLPKSPHLRDALEFNPDVGFIQGATVDPVTGAKQPGCMTIQLRFRPTLELLERCAKFVLGNEDCVVQDASAPWLPMARLDRTFQVPIQVNVPDQVMPVSFALLAQLDENDVSFQPSVLDFGTVYASQGSELSLKLTSHAAVPQRFSFINLPPEIEVLPFDGPSTLLPFESTTLRVILQPSSATGKDFSLTCRTSLNRTFSVRVRALAVDPPLQLSQTVVKFRPVAPGDWIEQSVFLRNVGVSGDPSRTVQDVSSQQIPEKEFQIVIPEAIRDEIKISPIVGTVAPGGSTRIEVEFSPKPKPKPVEVAGDLSAHESDGETPATGTAGPDGEAAGDETTDAAVTVDDAAAETSPTASTANEDNGSTLPNLGSVTESQHNEGAEPWSLHSKWLIPVLVRDKPSRTLVDDGTQASPSDPETYTPMFLSVQTTTVERVLVATPEAVSFNQVAVGNTETVTVRLQNVSQSTAQLVLQPLNPTGPFRVVNAIRPLAPNASLDVLVQFAPKQELRFCESLVVTSQLGRFAVTLTGQGVSPVLQMTPEDGRVDLGHVLAGRIVTQTITLENTSVFPLPVQLVPTSAQPSTFSNLPVFDCSPCELVVAPQKKRTVTIRFAPDHEQAGPYYFSYKVVTPNEKDADRTLDLIGHCWERQLFAVSDDPMALADPTTSSNDSLKFRVPRTLGVFASADASGATGGDVDGKPEDPFFLFDQLDALAAAEPDSDFVPLRPAEIDVLQPDRQLPRRLVLEFPKLDEAGRSSRSITVGSCAVDAAAGGAGGSFTLAFENGDDDGGFTASSMGGALSSGARTDVTFSFQQAAQEEDLPKGPVRITQWIERTLKLTLTGGFVPSRGTASDDAALDVEVVLRVLALR